MCYRRGGEDDGEVQPEKVNASPSGAEDGAVQNRARTTTAGTTAPRKEPKTCLPIHPCRNRSGHNPSGHKNHTPSIVPAPHAVAATPQNSRPDNARQTWSGTQTPVNAPAATIRPPENHIAAATYLFYHKILYDMQIKMEVPRYFSTFADRID